MVSLLELTECLVMTTQSEMNPGKLNRRYVPVGGPHFQFSGQLYRSRAISGNGARVSQHGHTFRGTVREQDGLFQFRDALVDQIFFEVRLPEEVVSNSKTRIEL